VTTEEDIEQQEKRIEKLPKRKQEKLRKAVELELKAIRLKAQVRETDQEFLAVTKGFDFTERILAERHALLHYLIETRPENDQ
jgi:ribosomal protein L9